MIYAPDGRKMRLSAGFVRRLEFEKSGQKGELASCIGYATVWPEEDDEADDKNEKEDS